MEVNEHNNDEMILVFVGDEERAKNDTSEVYEHPKREMPVPISVKVEPIEDVKGLYCNEDVKKIFPIVAERKEFIEVHIEPDSQSLDEEYLSQEDYLEDESTKDDVSTNITEANVPQKKRAPRKARHEYLFDEEEQVIEESYSTKSKKRKRNVPPKNRNRKTNLPSTKLAPKVVENIKLEENQAPVTDEDNFYEIEFLEDLTSPKAPISDEDYTECLDVPPKKVKRKTKISPKKPNVKKEEDDIEFIIKAPVSDEEYYEVEYLDDSPKVIKKEKAVTRKKQAVKKEEDEDFLPDEEDQDEFVEEEYGRPKSTRKKPGQGLTKQKRLKAPKNTNRKPRKPILKPPPKDKPIIKSFIAELCEKQPILKENEEKLIEYLANLMRKRRPPPPLPNSYILKDDDNEYSCSYCDVDTPTETAARRHYQHAHGARYLFCYACGDDFRSAGNLYKHEKRCRAPDADIQLRARGVFLGRKGRGRPYLFSNKFIPHEKPPMDTTQDKPSKFYCPHCPAVYCRNSLLKEHMHKHTGFRPYQCHECAASYVSQHQLNRHAKKHSQDRFVCDHCGKMFHMKNSLVSHMDTHLPRPRYGCGRCGRRYAQRSAVKVHIMRDHMNLPPPAACPVCPKRYNRMSHVKSHMKRDHGLILMTKNAIARNLPYMKLEDLEGAQIVLTTNEGDQVIELKSNEEVQLEQTTEDNTDVKKPEDRVVVKFQYGDSELKM